MPATYRHWMPQPPPPLCGGDGCFKRGGMMAGIIDTLATNSSTPLLTLTSTTYKFVKKKTLSGPGQPHLYTPATPGRHGLFEPRAGGRRTLWPFPAALHPQPCSWGCPPHCRDVQLVLLILIFINYNTGGTKAAALNFHYLNAAMYLQFPVAAWVLFLQTTAQIHQNPSLNPSSLEIYPVGCPFLCQAHLGFEG